MRTFKIICLIIILSFPGLSFGQNSQRNFSQILQTYYLHKDKDLLEKTIEALNDPKTEYERLQPILTGFFGALFSIDTVAKNTFNSNLNKLDNPEFKELFKYIIATNIDSIHSKTPLSTQYNDLNWSSFFATGDVKYIDKIVANIPLAKNRIDRNLFFTGASAKWSLCSNARQDKTIKEHLAGLKKNKKSIKKILIQDPQEYREEMIEVIREQRAKGLWTEKYP